MSKTITLKLPEELEKQLTAQAQKLNLPLETLIIQFLTQNSTVNNQEKLNQNYDWLEKIKYWKKIKQKLNLSKNFIQHEYLEEILKKLKTYLPTIYGNSLEKIILFGSQARGEAKPDSDIDILIVLKNPATAKTQTEKINQFISDLCLEYDVLISCVHVSEDQYNNENSPLLINIHREGIIL